MNCNAIIYIEDYGMRYTILLHPLSKIFIKAEQPPNQWFREKQEKVSNI